MNFIILALSTLLLTGPLTAKTVHVNFTGVVDDVNMRTLKHKLTYHVTKGHDIILNFNTPGGYLSSGFMFLRAFERLQKRGNIYCNASDNVISMGMVIFIHCNKRLSTNPKARMLHHNVGFYSREKLTAPIIEEYHEELKQMDKEFSDKFVEVTKMDPDLMKFLRDTDTFKSAEQMEKIAPCMFNLIKVKGTWINKKGCK